MGGGRGLTVGVEVDHCDLSFSSSSSNCLGPDGPAVLLVPNLGHRATVGSSLAASVARHLGIPAHLQLLSAPLFTRLSEDDPSLSVDHIYAQYCCHADADAALLDLHIDEETFSFFARENGRSVELRPDDVLCDLHIIDQSRLRLKRLPRMLPETGGRIFIETKDGILPLLGVSPHTQVLTIKQSLESMTGIPVEHQLLYSVGRVMHNDLSVKDFVEIHKVHEDSVLDLCKSGDSNAEQAHRRMAVLVNVTEKQQFELIVQGRDKVHRVMQAIESRTGFLRSRLRITFSDKVLQEKRMLGDYFIYPQCTLHVHLIQSQSPLKSSLRQVTSFSEDTEVVGKIPTDDDDELVDRRKPLARKLKLVRTNRGQVKGTLTIPVLTTDTVLDLKRKIKRTLQPLIERNLSMHNTPTHEPLHIDITPRKSTSITSQTLKLSSSSSSSANNNQISSPQGGRSFAISPIGSSSHLAPHEQPHTSSPGLHHLEEATFPSRKLHFEYDNSLPTKLKKQVSLREEGDQNHNLSEPCVKKGFGAWVSGNFQNLKEQVRLHFPEH